MTPKYVICFAARTEQEKGIHLGTPEFASTWEEATELARTRIVENVDIDSGHLEVKDEERENSEEPEDGDNVEEQFDANVPGIPKDFEFGYGNGHGDWTVSVTEIA